MSTYLPDDFLETHGFKTPDFNSLVYKYTTSEAFLKIIGSLSLRYSTPDTFKDTEELFIDRLDPTISNIEYPDIFSKYVEPIAVPGKPAITIAEAMKVVPINKFQEIHKTFYEIIRKTALIFCSTISPNSEKMWNEYALNDSGICFSMKLPEDFEIPYVAGVSKYVRYTDDISSFKQFPKTKEELSLALYNWIFTKRKSFESEEEIRTYISRDIDSITDTDQQYFYIPIKPDSVLEVYFGANCSHSVIEEISNLLVSKKCYPKKYKAIKTTTAYAFLCIP